MKGVIQNAPARLQLDQIQGNCLGGFNKDHQGMLFLRFKKNQEHKAKMTLRHTVLPDVQDSSSQTVIQFNNEFSALQSRGVPEGTIVATWTNLIFTFDGLQKLKPWLTKTDFPVAFTEGMRDRAAALGDTDKNAPAAWDKLVDWETMDAVVIVASDDAWQVDPNVPDSRISTYLAAVAAPGSGLELCCAKHIDVPVTPFQGPGQIYGRTRKGTEHGHEHFGFKDGVSQPGVRGVDLPDDPVGNPDQGHPGQDLLHPGEFVIGYHRQKPIHKLGHDGPNPEPGLVSGNGKIYKNQTGTDGHDAIDPLGSRVALPAWTMNGSFVVFRRLEQDVPNFNTFITDTATKLGLSQDLLAAKLVGRFKSGAPLEALAFGGKQPIGSPKRADPGIARPPLADDPALDNNFEYGDDDGDDPLQLIVPRAAHIRKVYPRDQIPLREFGLPANVDEDAESRTQTHRILRRGIPYGDSLHALGDGGKADAQRGLLFICYQSDIERQFEFVQRHWVNDANFPRPGAGFDALISNRPPAPIAGCPFHPNANQNACPVTIDRFVRTRGGGYFFSPSLTALADMLNPEHSDEESSMPKIPEMDITACLKGYGLPLHIANENYHFDSKQFSEILSTFRDQIDGMVKELNAYDDRKKAWIDKPENKKPEVFGLTLCFDFPQIGLEVTDTPNNQRRKLCIKFYCNGGD